MSKIVVFVAKIPKKIGGRCPPKTPAKGDTPLDPPFGINIENFQRFLLLAGGNTELCFFYIYRFLKMIEIIEK